jgi:predicted Zn-dependent peptidase
VEKLTDTPFFDLGATQWEYRDETSLVAYGVCRADSVPRSVDLLKEQLELLASDPPTLLEFEKARTRLEARFAAEAEWAMGLTLRVADSVVRRGDMAAYIDYLPTLQSLTPADVSAVIRRYLQSDRLCLVTMSPGSER